MNNTWDKCKNCGGERGLHHFETESEVDELRKSVKDLLARVEELEAQVERLQSGYELEESVRIFGAG